VHTLFQSDVLMSWFANGIKWYFRLANGI